MLLTKENTSHTFFNTLCTYYYERYTIKLLYFAIEQIIVKQIRNMYIFYLSTKLPASFLTFIHPIPGFSTLSRNLLLILRLSRPPVGCLCSATWHTKADAVKRQPLLTEGKKGRNRGMLVKVSPTVLLKQNKKELRQRRKKLFIKP